jgi:hypothetical protein
LKPPLAGLTGDLEMKPQLSRALAATPPLTTIKKLKVVARSTAPL